MIERWSRAQPITLPSLGMSLSRLSSVFSMAKMAIPLPSKAFQSSLEMKVCPACTTPVAVSACAFVACLFASVAVFVTGGRDGKIAFWDLRLPAAARISVPVAHSAAVLSSYSSAQPMEEVNSFEPFAVISHAHIDITSSSFHGHSGTGKLRKWTQAPSVTSLQFVDDTVLATVGIPDGRLKFWDVRRLGNKSTSSVTFQPFAQTSPALAIMTLLDRLSGYNINSKTSSDTDSSADFGSGACSSVTAASPAPAASAGDVSSSDRPRSFASIALNPSSSLLAINATDQRFACSS